MESTENLDLEVPKDEPMAGAPAVVEEGERRSTPARAATPDARPRRTDEFALSGTRPDYKDFERLRRYVSSQGKILPRRRTGLSARNQRLLAQAIKRARHLALLPMPGTLK